MTSISGVDISGFEFNYESLTEEQLKNLYTQTPLYEHKRWKLFIYKLLKWPKKWKPTEYKGGNGSIEMSKLSGPIIIDGSKHKFSFIIPDRP